MKVVWTELAEYRALASRGRVIPEIGLSTYREIFHAPYRVLYRVDATRIVILTLRHWHRNWDPSEVDGGA